MRRDGVVDVNEERRDALRAERVEVDAPHVRHVVVWVQQRRSLVIDDAVAVVVVCLRERIAQ